MDEDGEKVFDTHGLSFDSTLESLMEADYLVDDKDTSYIPPAEAEMSTQINYGVDLSSVEGGSSSCSPEIEMAGTHENYQVKPTGFNEGHMDMDTDSKAERTNDVVDKIETVSDKTNRDVKNDLESPDIEVAIVNEEKVDDKLKKHLEIDDDTKAVIESEKPYIKIAEKGVIKELNEKNDHNEIDSEQPKDACSKIEGSVKFRKELDVSTKKSLLNMDGKEKCRDKKNQKELNGECEDVNITNGDPLNTMSNKAEKPSTTSSVGKIDSLNLDELKAKRMRKLAEKSSVKSTNVKPEDSVSSVSDNSNKPVVKGSGKRKLEQLDDEEQETSCKQLKVETPETISVNDDSNSSITDEIIETDKDKLNIHDIRLNGSENSDTTTNNPMSGEDTESASEIITQVTSSDGTFNTESINNDTLTEDNNDFIIDEYEDSDNQIEQQGEAVQEDEQMQEQNSCDDSSDNDLDENEIEAWLDEGLNRKDDKNDKAEKTELDLKPGEYLCREKLVLEGHNIEAILLKLAQNVRLDNISAKFDNRTVGVKK